MKDYSELKGLPVKFINHSEGLKFNDCYVTEINDCGLTVLGYCLNHNSIPPDKLIKIYCLNNNLEKHLNEFPIAVEMILDGVIDDKKLEQIDVFFSYVPTCAFE